MPSLAMQLNDRALALARAGRVCSCACSAVFDGSSADGAGENAWGALRVQPTATSTGHLHAVLSQRGNGRDAALVGKEFYRRLAANPLQADERMWIAVPAGVGAEGLAALLAITRRQSLPIDGFVDSAVVSVAALGLRCNAVVLDVGLHHIGGTAVDVEGGHARRRRTVLCERAGILELYEAWLEMVSTTMVKRTRFDPLHAAAIEQSLFDCLPALARDAAVSGSAHVQLGADARGNEVTLTRDQFAHAAELVYRQVANILHELRPAGAAIALVMPRTVAEFPGMRDKLEPFVDCELVLLPDGFAAAATSLLDVPQRTGQEPVRLLRRLPLEMRPGLLPEVRREPLGTRCASGPAPSHVLLDGRAYSVGSVPLVVGRAPGSPDAPGVGMADVSVRAVKFAASDPGNLRSARSITLPEGLAGVSRRHCTFAQQAGALFILDHSSFGTFVNEERIAGRARVYAGDRVRVGDPGVQLALIAVGVPAT
ncbi:MAG TPA: FHA domain-containing protein [Steroidobacteraceae bacterium]